MNIKFVSAIIIMFSLACNTEHKINNVEFIHQQDKKFKTPKSHNIPYASQLLHTDSGSIFACYYKTPEIWLYDFSSQDSIGSIPTFVIEKKQQLFSFNIQNKDSVFMFFNAAYNKNYYHDSTLLLADISGKLKQVYSFAGSPVPCSENDEINKQSNFSVVNNKIPRGMLISAKYTFDDLLYSKNKLFIKFASTERKHDSLLVQYNIPAGGHINTDENIFYPHNVRLPVFGKGNYYARSYKSRFYAVSHKGNPLYAYGYNSEIIEYDLINKKTLKHNIKSLIIDTIMPTSDPDKNLMNREGRYVHFYYNKYDNKYYRFFVLPHDNDDPHAQFTKKGIWLHNTVKTSTYNDTLVYSLFTLDYKAVSKNDISKIAKTFDTANIPVQKEDPQAYINKYLNQDTNNIGIILIPAVSCQSCAIWAFSYFKDNIELMKKNNIFLIPSGNKALNNNYMQQSEMTKNQTNLKIDTSEIYLDYIDSFFNHRFLFSKNGKIVFDKIYSASGLYELPKDIKTAVQ